MLGNLAPQLRETSLVLSTAISQPTVVPRPVDKSGPTRIREQRSIRRRGCAFFRLAALLNRVEYECRMRLRTKFTQRLLRFLPDKVLEISFKAWSRRRHLTIAAVSEGGSQTTQVALFLTSNPSNDSVGNPSSCYNLLSIHQLEFDGLGLDRVFRDGHKQEKRTQGSSLKADEYRPALNQLVPVGLAAHNRNTSAHLFCLAGSEAKRIVGCNSYNQSEF